MALRPKRDDYLAKKKKKKMSTADRLLQKGQEQENAIKRMEELLPILDEAYEDFGKGKVAAEPKKLRRELDDLINQYGKGIIVRAIHKFKFQNVQSRYLTHYRPKWNKIVQEVRKRDDIYTITEVSEIEKKAIEKIFDEY